MGSPETKTQQGAEAVGDGDGGRDSLSITDNRTGQTYEVADRRRTDPGDRPAPDQGLRGRLRADHLRPGVHEHRLVSQRDHLHRRRRGDPASTAATRSSSWPRSPPTSRSPTCSCTASCRTAGSSRSCPTRSRSTPSFTRTSGRSCEGFRYDAHPMGMLIGVGGRAVHLLPRRQRDQGRGAPPPPDRSA